MAKSSADDLELRPACEAAIEGTDQKVGLSIRVGKSRGVWGKAGKIGKGQMAKPRVLAISTKEKAQEIKVFLHVLKYSNGGVLEVKELPAYVAVSSNSTPKDLFEDVLEELEKQLIK